ncbi:MAG: ROK family protein [Dehalococcoidales bacterium]|jgi:fructokinase
MAKLYGGIEAGGTKFLCAAGAGPENIVAKTQFPTTTPAETLGKAIDFFRGVMRETPLAAIGIASFGPLDLDKDSPAYGTVTTTPKPGWADTNLVKIISGALNVPAALETDVNGAALGEQRWGAARGLDTFIYLTVGTGIGGGGMSNGQLMHGLTHPEMGPIFVPHDLKKDPFPGCCPFHRDCLEGLASGAAVAKRWGKPAELLPADHAAWKLETGYLAAGVANLILTLSPKRIILGGGVMKKAGLLEGVRVRVRELLNGYVNSPVITEKIDEYIVAPALGDMAGVLGAIALAQQ